MPHLRPSARISDIAIDQGLLKEFLQHASQERCMQMCRIHSNVPHGFKTLGDEDVEYIEIFSPPKEENMSLR